MKLSRASVLLRSAVLLATVLGGLLGGETGDWPPPPGVIVAASPEPTTDFVGSPSIVVLPDGSYLVAHDIFGRQARELHTTRLFASRDQGKNWQQVGSIQGQFWSALFLHRGRLFLLGTNREYGDIAIRRSDDGGRSWTEPQDGKSGLLFRGRFHCAPVPFAQLDGRLWRGFEEYTGADGSWSGRYFRSFVISVPEEADLLDATNWSRTDGLDFRAGWLEGHQTGWLEGNVVVTPDRRLVNLLRLNTRPRAEDPAELSGPAAGFPRYGIAAMINIDPVRGRCDFDPRRGFIRFPGGQSKFTVRHDAKSGRYWSLVQKVTAPGARQGRHVLPDYQRNVLLLISSADLIDWQEHAIILRWHEGQPIHAHDRVGFQYVDWQIEGDDLVAVCRTAWNAASYHDANFITFHRVRDFRRLTPADSAPPLVTPAYVIR